MGIKNRILLSIILASSMMVSACYEDRDKAVQYYTNGLYKYYDSHTLARIRYDGVLDTEDLSRCLVEYLGDKNHKRKPYYRGEHKHD